MGKNLSVLWLVPLRILEDADGGGGSKKTHGGRVDGGRWERKQAGQTCVDGKRRWTGLWRWPDTWPGASWLRRPAAFPYTEVSKLVLWYSSMEEELLLLPFYRQRKRLRKLSRILKKAKLLSLCV